jgi:hypothetical protein
MSSSRESLPAASPAPFLFLRDRAMERSEGLAVAGRLWCPWPALTDQRRRELACVEARLAMERAGGRLTLVGSWVTTDSVRPFKLHHVDWLKRGAVDGLRVPIRIVPPTA